ncbi:MAG: type II toxin-antitoxin system death-on-curing family toxin [Oscillospiraceae bacterium]|nr:type II toxin-antitoxin system death-on-curing family toxin [Oscillospiraceae bacterium]
MNYLSKKQVVLLQARLVDAFGGRHGIRDEGLLDSALNAPFQSFSGVDLYPSILEKAARLCFGLIKNHPFVDGNKRIGTHAMIVFLSINHVFLEYDDEEIISLVLSLADGSASEEELCDWLRKHVSE